MLFRIYLIIIYISLFLNFSCEKKIIRNPSSPIKTLVILGSSTAAGTGASRFDSSWVGLLSSKFKRDQKEIKVINLAVGGYATYHFLPTNTDNMPGRPDEDTNVNITKALTYQPDYIIINLPTNDIAYNYSDAEILNNYKKITSIILNNKIPFLITSTQPRNFPEEDKRKRLKLFNYKLQTEYSGGVLDYYDMLSDSLYYIKSTINYGDGVHVNNLGHKIIFEELFKNKQFLNKAGY